MEYIECSVERALAYPILYINFYGYDGKKLSSVKRVQDFFRYQKAMGREKVCLWKDPG